MVISTVTQWTNMADEEIIIIDDFRADSAVNGYGTLS